MTDIIARYSHLSNRLNDVHTVCGVLRPRVRTAIVYVGYNHAMRISKILMDCGYRVVRHYGGGPAGTQDDGCMRVDKISG